MKHVHTPEMVAHLWANQSQDNARNPGGNFYFEGDTIYSYGSHFPIAQLAINKRQGKMPGQVVLFTTRTYSNTTSKHLWIVRGAIRHLKTIEVLNPRNSLEENLKHFEKEFKAAMVKAAGSRKGRSLEIKMAKAARILAQRNALAEFMGRKSKPMPEDFTLAIQAAAKAEARKVAAGKKRRQGERFDRLERAEKQYGTDIFSMCDAWRAGQQIPYKREYEILVEIAREKYGEKALTIPSQIPCMLRLINAGTDNEQVQTSWGAEVPAPHAFRIFKIWERVQGKVPPEGWTPKSQTEAAVGSFKVDSIEADGAIHAGCHTIPAQEVRAFGARMGWEG